MSRLEIKQHSGGLLRTIDSSDQLDPISVLALLLVVVSTIAIYIPSCRADPV